MAIHKSLPSSEVHEEKHIIDATAYDAGKVITPSSTDGVAELRKLRASELDYGIELTTGDSKKTLFPSATTDGEMELRQVTFPDLDFTGFCVTSESNKCLVPSSLEDGAMVLRQLSKNDIDVDNDVCINAINVTNDTYAITAAVDSTFATPSDYVVWPFALDIIENDNTTYDSVTKTFTIGDDAAAAAKYLSVFDCTLSSSTVTTRVGVAYKLNGTLVPYRFVVRANSAGEFMPGSRTRHLTLSAGDTLQLCIVCDKSCTLTHHDTSMSITRI